MDLSEAIEVANAQEFTFWTSDEDVNSNRIRYEEALKVLIAAWQTAPLGQEPVSFSLIRDLADRNRDTCDTYGIEKLERVPAVALKNGLSAEDHLRGVAVLQGRSIEKVTQEAGPDANDLGAAYVAKRVGGTVVGIDLETTSVDPARGYIINLGMEFWNVGPDTKPVEPFFAYFGLPSMYEEKGVPLARIHKIQWSDLAGKTPFRQAKKQQQALLEVLTKMPYMAHNASFEDSWLMMHVDGYAEARKEGKILPIDTREIVRKLDPGYKSAPRESRPAALESWAKRRGTLAADESERHLGLEDVDLMFRTVQAEFTERNMF